LTAGLAVLLPCYIHIYIYIYICYIYIQVKKNIERIIKTFLKWVSNLDPSVKDNEKALSFAVQDHEWKNLNPDQMIDPW
jgi:hypothetical protein